jgi:hypothetical protein
MRTELSVEIDRPIEEVFDKTFDCVPAWSIIVVEDEPIEEKPEVIGSTFRTVTEENGRRMEFIGTVLEHERPRRSRIGLTHKAFDLDVTYLFEPTSTGTRVTQHSEALPNGLFMKLMFGVMGRFMRKSSCDAQLKELNSLKAFCESDALAGADS